MIPIRYYLADEYNAHELVKELQKHLTILPEHSGREVLTFYDTFDWRLFNASRLLYRSGLKLFLGRLPDNELLHAQPSETEPEFIQDFPESALRAELEPILEMRALIKLTEVDLNSTSFRILNKDDKTVVRLIYQSFKPSHQPTSQPMRQLCLKPIRGYAKDGQKVEQRLKAMGLVFVQESLFLKVIALGDRIPGDYSTKLKYNLEPGMRADEATKIILRDLLQTIRMNEAGIKADLDTEFLHDFRVAVRRTRAALSQIKGVFPEAPTFRFRQELAYIGTFTNELRDLDVYLLAENSYKARLPASLQNGLNPLLAYLKQKRLAALETVINELNSQKYADILHDWEVFLNEPGVEPSTAANAGASIIELARNRIYKRYRRIVKWGQQILENVEDDQLHALRIECKKLRYLLEFFQSLFPDNEITASIKQLKILQNNLGDFNDLCVQEDYLGHIVGELPLNGAGDKQLFLTIGYLINTLHQERERVKADFAQTFAGFATPANKELFKTLFAA